jgi:hypothetical protein
MLALVGVESGVNGSPLAAHTRTTRLTVASSVDGLWNVTLGDGFSRVASGYGWRRCRQVLEHHGQSDQLAGSQTVRHVTEDSMSIDWVAISGAASAAASIAAVASVVLAYRGVRISRDGSALDRRNYLDGIFVRWLDSIDALDRAALPYLSPYTNAI